MRCVLSKNVIEQSPHNQCVSTAKRLKVCNVQGASGLNRANSRRTESHCTLFTSECSRLAQSGSSGIVAFHPGMVESITSQVNSRDCLVNPLTMPSTAVTSGALTPFRDALSSGNDTVAGYSDCHRERTCGNLEVVIVCRITARYYEDHHRVPVFVSQRPCLRLDGG